MEIEHPGVTWYCNGEGPYWLLLHDLNICFPDEWDVSIDGVAIRKGFRCDLASIPRGLSWLIQPHELSVAAPMVHDFLYENHESTRRDADLLLRLIAQAHGVGRFRRWASWVAVRLFGWFAWRK